MLTSQDYTSENKKEKTVPHCKKIGHNNQAIQSICLNEQCEFKRQLCKHCFFEHRHHLISTLNGGQFDPLSILSVNSSHKNANKLSKDIKSIYENSNKTFFNNIYSIIDLHRNRFIQKLEPDFQTIWGSYDQSTTVKNIQKIKSTLGQQQPNQSIELFIKMLNNLLGNTFNIKDQNFVMKVVQYQKKKLENINEKLSMQQMQQQIKNLQIKYINSSQIQKIQKEGEKHISQAGQKVGNKVNSKKTQDKWKKQENSKLYLDKQLVDIGQFEKNKCGNSKNKVGEKIKKPGRQRKCSKGQKFQISQKPKKKIKQDSLEEIEVHQFSNIQNKSTFGVQTKHQKLQKLYSHTIINLQIGRQKQILKKLNKNVKQLIIKSESGPQAIKDQCIQQICSLSLNSLRIKWCNSLSYQSIIKIINILNLTELSLQNCSNFNQQCGYAVIKKLPNLKKLHYGVDFKQSFKEYHQSLYFMEQDRDYSLSLQFCTKMAKSLKNLTNIWIGSCQHQSAANIIKNLPNLTQITLGQFTQNTFILKPRLIQVLKIYQLTSLTLLSINNCLILKKAIHKLNSLQSLVFIGCKGIDDGLLKLVSQNCKQLCQLSLDLCQVNINGSDIWQMVKLKTLVLSKVKTISKQNALIGLPKLQRLQFLDLRQNEWVDDQMSSVFPKLLNLKYLCIAVTNLTDASTEDISKLYNLQSLICGNSKINGQSLCKITRQCKKIKKLSVAGLDGKQQLGLVTEKQMQQLCSNVKLTHLNIYKCTQLGDSIFDYLPNLVCTTVFGSKVTKQCKFILKYKGVYVQDKE